MKKKLRVLVLCGGKSAERHVSLSSAKTILSHLDRRKFDPELVFIDPGGRWLKADAKRLSFKVEDGKKQITSRGAQTPGRLWAQDRLPDVVFPALHGPMGEDGTVQGLFETAGIPYVGCGVLGSAVGMDKEITKRLALEAGLPVLPYVAARRLQEAEKALAFGFPLFVKPARLGSSVGVSKVKKAEELEAALKRALEFDDKAIIEKGIEAREIECAVLGDPWAEPSDPLSLKASVCGEIVPHAEFYTYEAKYIDENGAELLIPAPIGAETAAKIQDLSMRAFRALDGYSMGRVDFLLDKGTGAVYFLEVNTIPGFTPASMYPLLWKKSGLGTPELLTRLVELALRRSKARSLLKN